MEIAHGHINVTLSDQEAIAGLRNVDREFDRTMRKIEAKEAEASVGANLTQLRRDLREAEALIKAWESKVANARTRGQRRYRTEQLEAARAVARNLSNEIRAHEANLRVLKQQNRERDAAAAKEKAIEQATRRQLREQEQVTKQKQRQVELSQKEVIEAAKLQRQYSKLQSELQKIEQRRGGLLRRFDRPAQIRLRIDQRDVEARIEETRRRLIMLGETPIQIPRDVDRGRLAKWLADLTQMTVRIGPFTTTIAQLSRAMLLLGPVIIGLLGSVAALTGAIGAGLVGAIGVAGAALTGFGLSALGVGLILKPLVADYQEARKASDAYYRAVLKHGEGSDQAKKKQEELNNVLKGVDPAARKAFTGISKLGDRWRRLTADARPEFFNVIADGVRTIDALMPAFARNSVQAFKAVGDGVREWMAGLRSAEGQRILDNIFGRFADAIPSILRGFGNLGTAVGRIFESFSRHFVGLGRGFEAWTQGIANATGRTGKLNSTVDKLVGSMRSVGRFIAAAGRVLVQFFRAAAGPGVGALDSMTNSLNGLAQSMSTVQGQRGMRQFFEDALETTGKFFAALKPLVELFFEFTTIMTPFTNVALGVVKAVGDVVQALADLAPTRVVLQGIVALWTAWSIAKIIGIAGAIGRVGAALRALAVGQGAMAALGVLFGRGAAGAAAGAAAGGAASGLARTAATATIAGVSVRALGLTMLRFAGPAGLAAAAALTFGKNTQTAGEAADSATNKSKSLSQEVTAASRSLAGSYTNIANNSLSLASANDEVSAAQRRVNALQARGKTGTAEYRDAIFQLNMAIQQRSAAEREIAGSQQNLERAQAKMRQSAQAVATANEGVRTGMERARETIDKLDPSNQKLIQQWGDLEHIPLRILRNMKPLPGMEDDFAEAIDGATNAQERFNAAQRHHQRVAALAQLGQLNYQRSVQGLLPISAQAAMAVARLNRVLGQRRVAQVAFKFPDPREAQRVMQSLNRAISAGIGGRRAFNLVINSKNAEQAVARLKAAMAGLSNKEIRIIEKGGKEAIRTVEQLAGRKLTPKEQRIVEEGGARALAMIARIEAQKIREKRARVIAEVGQALSGIGSVISRLGQIPRFIGVTVAQTFTSRGRQFRPGASGGVMSPLANGGPVASAIERANNGHLPMVDRQTTSRGRVINKPTLLVGEENRSEIVIATNPLYRQSNLQYLGLAARALGANAMLPDGTILAQQGFGGAGGYYAPAPVPEPPPAPPRVRRRPSRRRPRKRDVYRSQNAWAAHIGALKTQQDDWERELGIRQQEIVEPEDLIREVGRTPEVIDPVTGEKSGNEPIYEVDQAEIDRLSAAISRVRDAYLKLVEITAAIVSAVPQAIQAGNSEINFRRQNIDALQDEVRRYRARKRAARNADQKRQYQDRIDRAERRIERERDAIENLKDDNKTFADDRKEAGFDWREFSIGAEEQRREIEGLGGRAAGEVTSANPQQPTTGTGGGGTAGDGGLTPDQQALLAQAEEMRRVIQTGTFINAAVQQVVGGQSSQFGGTGAASVVRRAFAPTASLATTASSITSGARAGSLLSPGTTSIDSGGFISARTGQPIPSGGSGGGSYVNIEVKTLYPADPATLDAIGRAATAGQSLQGAVISPRTNLGL